MNQRCGRAIRKSPQTVACEGRLVAFLFLAALAVPAGAAAEWLSLRSEHFHVIGNAGEGQLRTIALKLEQFREVVGQALSPSILREGSAPPVVVLVFRDSRSYEPFMPRADGRIDRVAGYFLPASDVNYITLTLQAGAQAYSAIFHEYSHVLLRGMFAEAPVWFNEGLAEYYSTFEVTGGGRFASIGKPIPRHVGLLQARRMPFARLFAVDRTSPEYTRDSTDRRVLYAQSWAIVHHALHAGAGRWDQLLAFVARLADGHPTEASFREAYEMELRDLERELHDYVRRPIYQSTSIRFPDSLVTRVEARATTISDAEADAWLGDLLAHTNRDEEAVARLEMALAAQPDLPLAHASLGTLRMRQGKTGEAVAHLERAVTLGTISETAHYTYALALIRGRPGDREARLTATRALERAIEIRPGYSEARLLLASTHLTADNHAAVRDVLAPLVRVEPGNHRAALVLGESLLQLGSLDDAEALLRPVLARSVEATERDRARRLLAASAGLQIRRKTLAAAGMAMPDGVLRLNAVPAFRTVAAGEQRTYGIFESLECGRDGVAVVVATAAGRLRARAPSLEDVKFIAYRRDLPADVTCGFQATPREVYLTWRTESGRVGVAAGTAVAVEVLPDGFVPEP